MEKPSAVPKAMAAFFCGLQLTCAAAVAFWQVVGTGAEVLPSHMGSAAITGTVPLFVVQQLRAVSSCPQQNEPYSPHGVNTASEDRNLSPEGIQLVSTPISPFDSKVSWEPPYPLCTVEDSLCYSTSCRYILV